MRWMGVAAAVALAILLATGCTSEPLNPAPIAAPRFRHDALRERLMGDAADFTFKNGDWLEDYGDAPFYGLAHHAYTAPQSTATWSARDRALATITDVDFFADDLQEVTMSALGLIAYIHATGDRSALPTLDLFIDQLDGLVGGIGHYIQPGLVDSWALRTYGSTAVSALVALINAEYALRVGGERAPERTAWAREASDRIAEIAHDPEGPAKGGWAFGPDRDELFLYPNVAMILLDGRLHELTEDDVHRARALAAYDAIQRLRLSQEPTRYFSPYSAAAMGATSSDYSTLSSHNYLMLALAVLFEITGDDAFVHELDSVLDAMETQLYGRWCLSDVHRGACEPACDVGRVCLASACSVDRCSHAVLHHWIDGRPAHPIDPELVCTGCNLQLLYVLWYRAGL